MVEALLWRLWSKAISTCGGWLHLRLRYRKICVGFCNFSVQWRPFPDEQNVQKKSLTICLYFHSKVDGRPWTIEVDEELL
jgi:hypothetical protein